MAASDVACVRVNAALLVLAAQAACLAVALASLAACKALLTPCAPLPISNRRVGADSCCSACLQHTETRCFHQITCHYR